MSRANLRSLCLQALCDWEKTPRYAETIIDRLATHRALDERDRGFLNEVVLGVLRNLLLLDHRLARLRERGKVRPDTRNLLRIGLYQLFHMRVPDHAAVAETVSLAKTRQERGLVNAILRRAVREREEMRAEEPSLPLGIRYSLPDFLVEKWAARFGEDDLRALCEGMNRPAKVFLRANLLQPEAIELLPAALTPLAADVRFFEVERIREEWIEGGMVYVQDPSTAIACDLLEPLPGDTVLDACAAPGGKTSLLAEKMRNTGRIVACEKSEHRLERLRQNLARLRVENTDAIQLDWDAFTTGDHAALPAEFDAILVDAPCTNTGVMRRRADVRWRLHEKSFVEMAELQFRIVQKCLPLLRMGGKLVYSTCSLEPEENREVIDRLLAAHPGLALLETRESLPFRDGFDGAYAALLERSTPRS